MLFGGVLGRKVWYNRVRASVAELVYAFDLKSNGEIHMSSSLIRGTRLGCFGGVVTQRSAKPRTPVQFR